MRDADILEVDDEHVEIAQHLGRRLARLAVQRVDRHAADLVVRVPRLDHVVLHVRPEPVLRAENGGQLRAAGAAASRSATWRELAIDRRRVADDADAAAVERGSRPAAARIRAVSGISHDYRRCPLLAF